MIRGRCPICGKSFAVATLDDLPSFPFCTERCRLVDLGRWIDEKYAVAGRPPADGEDEPDVAEEPEEE